MDDQQVGLCPFFRVRLIHNKRNLNRRGHTTVSAEIFLMTVIIDRLFGQTIVRAINLMNIIG